MEFLKSDTVYSVIYSKEQAVDELKKDSRIDSIISTNNTILITTHAIIPYSSTFRFLSPIGIYTIKIFDTGYLTLSIKRIGGGICNDDIIIPHIRDSFGICWGNMAETVETIKIKKDWYWLAKKCLDLLEDGEMREYPEHLTCWFCSLQIKFMLEINYKNKKELINLLRDKIESFTYFFSQSRLEDYKSPAYKRFGVMKSYHIKKQMGLC